MLLEEIAPVTPLRPSLQYRRVPLPDPKPDEIRIRVHVCGVCHTELDEIEGRTPPPALPVIPGHQVVGVVECMGDNATRFEIGDRVGVGWIFSSSGDTYENLSRSFRATGRDANGGYAEFMVISEQYAHPIPSSLSDEHAAPLLCAGAVGYRALKLSNLVDGEPLGFTGFGGSAHIVLQVAKFVYPSSPIYVFTRSKDVQEFALSLGAHWSGDIDAQPPESAAAIIDTTPAWNPVLRALENLRPGGRLVINAIRKEDDDKHILRELNYEQHLWLEKEIKSVANVTGPDIADFLQLAARIPIRPTVERYPLEKANLALQELKQGKVKGAKVLYCQDPS